MILKNPQHKMIFFSNFNVHYACHLSRLIYLNDAHIDHQVDYEKGDDGWHQMERSSSVAWKKKWI